MDITVNQQTHSVIEFCTVQQMLDTIIKSPTLGIAVAINQKIIAKSNWETYPLQHGDQIIIIKATQGG